MGNADRRARAVLVTAPPEVIAWNRDKTYLADLAAAGVPVVPTSFLRPGGHSDPIRPESEN